MEKSEYYLEVEVTYINGKKDWISPIEDIQKNIIVNRIFNNLEVDNGCYVYSYNIENLSKVDIVKILDHDEIGRENLYSFSV